MTKHKNKIITAAITLTILAVAFFAGGSPQKTSTETYTNRELSVQDSSLSSADNALDKKTDKESFSKSTSTDESEFNSDCTNPIEEPALPSPAKENIEPAIPENVETPPTPVQPDQNNKSNDEFSNALSLPPPSESQNTEVAKDELTCTLSVRCDTVLNNISSIDKEKVDIVPKDGIIYAERSVTFYEGESVFNLLMREMKQNKIHMEYTNPPLYNSAYIEGIANIYEFDLGELSGWMYKVNGIFPNYGSSRYKLKDGDRVEWVYTCDLGKDVGGEYSAGNGR